MFGSFFLYVLTRFSVAFGKLLYKSTIGAFIALCLKIWYMLKFCGAYVLALIQKFYRFLRVRYRKTRTFARKRARRASRLVLSKAAGQEAKSVDEIEEEENKMLKDELASDAKAAEKERKEEGLDVDSMAGNSKADGESAGASTFKSEGSGGAVNAIEEASRKMKLIALKAYQTKVIKSRLERTDYSANLFHELNMVSLDQLFERSMKEYQDFKALFNINDATERYL